METQASTRPRRDASALTGSSTKRTLVTAARKLHPISAAAVAALVCVQVYLIAAFILGAPGALDAHMTVGRVTIGLEVLVFATGVIGWPRDRWQVGLSSALLLVGILQGSLAKDVGSSPQVHALHGLLALVVFVLAWQIAARSQYEIRRRPEAAN